MSENANEKHTQEFLEIDEDVEGHRRVMADGVEDEEDVEGHVQPPRDLDIER